MHTKINKLGFLHIEISNKCKQKLFCNVRIIIYKINSNTNWFPNFGFLLIWLQIFEP